MTKKVINPSTVFYMPASLFRFSVNGRNMKQNGRYWKKALILINKQTCQLGIDEK